jgi:hypothetical protein
MGGLVLLMLAFVWRDRSDLPNWGLDGRGFVPAARFLAVPTVLMVAAPIAAVAVVGTDFQPGRAGLALAAYPLYAFAQMLVFQLFLVRRLVRISGTGARTILISAGIFSLVHWPNGLLMGACFVGACVWTAAYLRRPNLYAIALSMGLAAASFASFLPRDLTRNLRTGPIYVQRLLEARK